MELSNKIHKYRISFVKEQNEYAKLKEYNKTLNFNSIDDYINTKETNKKYIEDPKEYFGHIWTNWYDFLQIDTSIYIQDKHEWKKFCQNNNVLTVKDYYNLCDIHKQLPRSPNKFYIGFTNLGYELGWKFPRFPKKKNIITN
jgi:hypothetical protein